LAMYIVISMPYRMSIACGISHFITMLLWFARRADHARGSAGPIGAES
jgi:hypothetical protein